ERPPEMSVHHEDDERRNEQHSQQRELIRRRQGCHRDPASVSILLITSIASWPVTALDGWTAFSPTVFITPAAPAIDSAGYARCVDARSLNRRRADSHGPARRGFCAATFPSSRAAACAR